MTTLSPLLKVIDNILSHIPQKSNISTRSLTGLSIAIEFLIYSGTGVGHGRGVNKANSPPHKESPHQYQVE